MNSEDFQASKQSLTFLLYRGQPQFQAFSELKTLINNDQSFQTQITYHSLDLKDQHEFDILQLNKLKKIILTKGGLYQSETYIQYFGDFVPPQVQRYFQIQLLNLRILKTINPSKEFQALLPKANSLSISISLLSDEQLFTNTLQQTELSTSIEFENGKAKLYSKEGVYKVGHNYQGKFGDYALVTCKNQDKFYLAFIKLRDNNVNEKWLGKTFTNYQNYAIQFNATQVAFYQEITQDDLDLISQWQSLQGLEDCQIALREILRLTDICYKFCSMRKQFRTTDDKKERSILTYQVTLTRLINAISFAFMYYISTQEAKKEFLQDVGLKKPRRKQSKKFVDFYSLYITEQCVLYAEYLRDMFGGFGFLKVSGVPQIQEKLVWLSSFYKDNRIQKQTDYLNLILDTEQNKQVVLFYLGQYFMGEPKRMFSELGPLNKSNISNPFHIFGYHVAKIKEKLEKVELLKYSYSAFQFSQLTFELFSSQKFFTLLAFRRYRASNFILDRLLLNQNFQALQLMETNGEYLDLIKNQIGLNVQETLAVLNILIDSYEFQHYGFLLGEENQELFYEKLINSSKNQNLRNTLETVRQIRAPVVDLLNRPNL